MKRKVFCLSYNCSAGGERGVEVGSPEDGFSIDAISTDFAKLVASIKETNPETDVSTTYTVVGLHVVEMGNGEDTPVVAAVIEDIEDGNEKYTTILGLIFETQMEVIA